MDPLVKVPERLASYILAELYRGLPPPIEACAEATEVRDLVAMASVAKLAPMNTAEARLAVNAVAAQAHAIDALASAGQYHDDFKRVMQCRSQAAMMMRLSAVATRELRTMQEIRETLMARKWAEDEAEARRSAAEADAAARAQEATTAQTREANAAQARETSLTDARPDPDTPHPDAPHSDRADAAGTQPAPSHAMDQRPTEINNETTTGIVPSVPAPRASPSALIAAWLPGTVPPTGIPAMMSA